MGLGCATTPPPSIQAGTYINHQYQFSAKLPDQWFLSDKARESFSKYIPVTEKYTFGAVFSSEDQKSHILLAADKTDLDWSAYKLVSDQLPEIMEKKYAEDRRQLLQKNPFIHQVEYTLYPDEIKNCDGNCMFIHGKITAENTGVSIKCTYKGIIYQTKYGMFAVAYWAFFSGPDRHDADLPLFDAVVDSFKPF
jgi:hypothetical protein